MKDKYEYVSQREFARRVGVSHVWVHRQVSVGSIPCDPNKGIPWELGLEAYEAAKVVGYDGAREYHAEQRAKRKKGEAPPRKQAKPSKLRVPTVVVDDDDEEEDSGGMVSANAAKVGEKYNQAKLVEKTYQAKLRELEYRKLKRELIPLDEVKSDAIRIATLLQQRFTALGMRVGARCEGRTAAEIDIIIREETNRIIEEIHRSEFVESKDE